MPRLRSALPFAPPSRRRLRSMLPEGRLLPDERWRRRHREITILLWLHVPALLAFGLARGHGLHGAAETAVIAAFAALATAGRFSRTTRATAASAGLVTCSAILVHFWDGAIEGHFHFFVAVALLALYQDWVPFLVAIAYVAVHHGLAGTIAPEGAFDHPGAQVRPWVWALVHAGFMAAAAAANLVAWRANEQSIHDPLTGLAGRVVLADRLDRALEVARRQRSAVALLFIDLDRFKRLNDSLGHGAGDRVLALLAGRLRETVCRGDLPVRFGGDEFVVVCELVTGSTDALRRAEEIAAALRRPVEAGGHELTLTVSVGIALATGAEGEDPEGLIRDADAAMYRAKERGKDRCELFGAALRAAAVERLAVEAGLRLALERDELRLHFQPEVNLRTGRIRSVEALLRWQHPERGLLGPGAFISVAEDTGLIVPLGRWALVEACRQIARLNAAAPPGAGVGVSVNLSARQLHDPELAATVSRALRESGLPGSALCLELTESVLIEDLEPALLTLQPLRRLGVRLALDDFGTGYSSLSYLHRLHVDRLKIDRSFITGLMADSDEETIVRAVISLGRGLGHGVTAEGIETIGQLERLRALGCQAGQGFLFSRPVPAGELEALVGADLCPPAFQLRIAGTEQGAGAAREMGAPRDGAAR